jgi:ribosomal protein S18 acetylase RimI-like enzyme
MSGPPAVRRARADEFDAASAILTDAFVDEDGLNYWLRQGPAKTRARRAFFDAAVRRALNPKRDLWLAEADSERLGAAIWLAPGLKAFDHGPVEEVLLLPLLLRIAGVEGMRKARALGAKLASHHPREPHAHLTFIGVSSAAQGRGVGSELLKQTLAPLDAAGVTAYLEASTERNVTLYQRYGFEVTGGFELPGLRFWCMTRTARG